MPNPLEIAEIVVGGTRYRDWTSFKLEMDYTRKSRVCTFTAVEDVKRGGGRLSGVKIKTGDQCKIYLAGALVMTGIVYVRQVSYNATQHGVQLTCASRTMEASLNTVKMTKTQYRKYNWQAIAKDQLGDIGINLLMKNAPPNISKKFRDVSAIPGETVYSFLERLARMRGIYLQDDENGNLVATQGTENGGAELVEGRNILEANVVVQNKYLISSVETFGQHRGSDESWGDDAATPNGKATGTSKLPRTKHIPVEDSADDDTDAKYRAMWERNWLQGAEIEANIKVQGWLKPDGQLWKFGEKVKLKSPMLLFDEQLAIKVVVFQQDNATGTTTLLQLCKPEHLSPMEGTNAGGQTGILP